MQFEADTVSIYLGSLSLYHGVFYSGIPFRSAPAIAGSV
ncbi:MAG: hypothetical protein ACYDH3_04355 [Candidatus Aminicenantales bacterium]